MRDKKQQVPQGVQRLIHTPTLFLITYRDIPRKLFFLQQVPLH